MCLPTHQLSAPRRQMHLPTHQLSASDGDNYPIIIENIHLKKAQLAMLITQLQHPDSIWTWPNSRGKRAAIWIPYLSSIEKKKSVWTIRFQGGSLEFKMAEIDFMMMYGSTEAAIPVVFLEDANKANVVIAFHRRNVPRPVWIWTPPTFDKEDLLTAQILARENQIKCCHVARTLVRLRIQSFEWRRAIPHSLSEKLKGMRAVAAIRAIEAAESARYWSAYFEALGLHGEHRIDRGAVQAALNVCSVFMAGIVLRWLLFHRLSPSHGFLHEPTGYPALVYDLIEPYRVWMERAVFESVDACRKEGGLDEVRLIRFAIENLKDQLETFVCVPALHVEARRKNLLHGIVLALRAYLSGNARRFYPPMEGRQRAGRPIESGYALPGARTPRPV